MTEPAAARADATGAAGDDLARRGDEVLLLVRVWLADRPGALGQVASRIGAMRGDIVGVDVLERATAVAIDEFAVALPSLGLVDLLVREIEEVDGASVEEWRVVDRFPDPRLDGLRAAEKLATATSRAELHRLLVHEASEEFALDWAAIVEADDVAHAIGAALPALPVLRTLAAGVVQPPAVSSGEAGPDDLAVAPLPSVGATLLAGRAGHPFRRRERTQLVALARIAEQIARLVGD